MRKIIYFVFFLTVMFACNHERKPLEILPIMAEDLRMINDSMYERKDYPIPKAFYVKNFKDDKRCLGELLSQILNNEEYIDLYSTSRGAYFEDGEGHVNQKHSFYINHLEKQPGYFEYFRTWSKLWLNPEDFPQRCDYKYNIVRNDKVAVVYFDYKEFNTDVWQKFINVVFYDRDSIGTEDQEKYNLWIPGQARDWRNWSAPTRYSLLNQRTKEIECIIKYPLADNYDAFTMEIH